MLTSHELFGFMSPALAGEILNYTFDEEKATYRATLAAVTQAKHVRPVFLERQPRAQRDAAILSVLSKPLMEAAAAALLRSWLVKKHATMLEDFLNTLGIKNEKGVVEELPSAVEEAKLKTAVDSLLAKYPPEVVAVYLNAFNGMNEANWASLKSLLESDARLQFGQH